jgi:hypothetical protein
MPSLLAVDVGQGLESFNDLLSWEVREAGQAVQRRREGVARSVLWRSSRSGEARVRYIA